MEMDQEPVTHSSARLKTNDGIRFPDLALGRLGDWTPPSLHLDWDPVPDLVAERNRNRYCGEQP
jgi:hypothetical protein